VIIRCRKIIPGALVFENINLLKDIPQGDVDKGAGLFFDDDGVYSEGFCIEGVLELVTEEMAVGEEGELDAVPEGIMPSAAAAGCIAADDKAPFGGL
jgi:hypothetical protein